MCQPSRLCPAQGSHLQTRLGQLMGAGRCLRWNPERPTLALKKSDLYSSLWSSADELRGSMDASQYKDYVLTLLFVKYVSDKAKADPYALIQVPEGAPSTT